MKRPMTIKTAVLSVSALLALGTHLPNAWGHASISPGRAPRDSDVNLQLNVPVEPPGHSGAEPDLAARHNQRVTVEMPRGITGIGCDPKPGWTCAVNQGASTPHIAFDRTGEPVSGVDSFTLEVHTSGPGRYPLEVNQTYSDGDVAHWDGPAGSDNAAPTLDVS